MTTEMQKSLERELADAKSADDVTKAQSHILLALMDCQRKTAERVKTLGWKFTVAMVALGAGGGVTAVKWEVVSKIIFGN
ncbi:MAG: hypothetical protein IJ829_05815 [Kiritimatiellae bacterium]|nr:hypothetical protein [Kiritimatiellia bacterium]